MKHKIGKLTKRSICAVCMLLPNLWSMAQTPTPSDSPPHIVYFIPGQGADHRSFQYIELQDSFEVRVLEFLVPEPNEEMPSYARRMAAQIDTTTSFSLIGASLGGMIAVEMNTFLRPKKTIILSSIKGRHEMPIRYKFLRYLPLHKVFGGKFYIWSTNLGRPFVEPEGKAVEDLARSMLAAKDPNFMKRAIHCIVTWDNTEVPDNLIHIHGDKDHTLPFRYIKDVVTIKGGSHMIVMTRPKEISALLNQHLGE